MLYYGTLLAILGSLCLRLSEITLRLQFAVRGKFTFTFHYITGLTIKSGGILNVREDSETY